MFSWVAVLYTTCCPAPKGRFNLSIQVSDLVIVGQVVESNDANVGEDKGPESAFFGLAVKLSLDCVLDRLD
jgi:hypothetical protein